jgi:hypothetical protein
MRRCWHIGDLDKKGISLLDFVRKDFYMKGIDRSGFETAEGREDK